MRLLANQALQAFQALLLDKQRDILLRYVSYVEEALETRTQPVFFLEWWLLQPGEEVPDAET